MADLTDPASPQAAAVAWVSAVVERGDLLGAWALTDPQLRLVLAQDWVWSHRHDAGLSSEDDRVAAAAGLAATPPLDEHWSQFADDFVATWRQAWRGFGGEDGWYVEARPEILDLDLELVTFVEAGAALTRRFVLRHQPQDGWVVAGVNGDQLYEPGWPPRLGRAAGQP